MDRRVFLKTVPAFTVLAAAKSALAQEADPSPVAGTSPHE